MATVASVLGGIAGWALGYFAYESIAMPIREWTGKLAAFETMRGHVTYETVLLLLVSSGLAHVPPIKIVTILSGVIHMNIWLFIASAIGGAKRPDLQPLSFKVDAGRVNFVVPGLKGHAMVEISYTYDIAGVAIKQFARLGDIGPTART